MDQAVWYRVPEVCDESWYSVYSVNVAWSPDDKRPLIQEAIACACARDYWEHHGGRECSWPLTIVVHSSEDGPVLLSAVVSVEMEPRYSGRLVAPPKEHPEVP